MLKQQKYLFYNFYLQKNKSKKNVNQTDTDAIKKKKLTSRKRKALLKIIEKKQKSQKVIFFYFYYYYPYSIPNMYRKKSR